MPVGFSCLDEEAAGFVLVTSSCLLVARFAGRHWATRSFIFAPIKYYAYIPPNLLSRPPRSSFGSIFLSGLCLSMRSAESNVLLYSGTAEVHDSQQPFSAKTRIWDYRTTSNRT